MTLEGPVSPVTAPVARRFPRRAVTATTARGVCGRPAPGTGYIWVLVGVLAGGVGAGFWRGRAQRRFELTGQDVNRAWPTVGIVLAGALIGWVVGGMPTQWSVPERLTFMIEGGASMSPEFLAVLVSLVAYTAAFVAE